MFDMAVAGSTNAVLHILSIAYELGIKITMEDFEKYAEEIPCITGVPTITGKKCSDILQNVKVESTDIIRSLDNSLYNEPGLKVLRGNLSPNGAIVRPTGVPKEMK